MTNIIPPPMDNPAETVVDLGRLNNLSDCIFGFALTLLVLDIRLPDSTSDHDLATQLIALGPKLLIYLISFVVIGGAWGSHQRMLSHIRRGDGLLVWLNLLSLLFVTFLPAAANLLGRFPGEFVAVLCFAADVILIQLTALWLWRHASRNGLITATLDPRVVIGVGRRLTLGAVAFTASVVLALVNTNLVYVVWIGLFTVMFVTDWLSWEQALKKTQAAIPLEGSTRGQLDIVHGVGHLTIVATASDDVLVDGAFGGGLDSQVNHVGDSLEAHFEVSKRLGLMNYRYPWAWGSVSALDWNLRLNRHIPLKLNVVTNADQADMVLTDAQITDIRLQANGSNVDLRLPANAGQTFVHIQASNAYLIIQVPPGVGARIHAANSLSNVEADLTRFSSTEDGTEYISGNYNTAANCVEINLDQTLSFVKLV